MVARFSDNYSAIAKDCCGDWETNPSFSLAKCSKLCSKLSVEFKHLHSVILCITNQTLIFSLPTLFFHIKHRWFFSNHFKWACA